MKNKFLLLMMLLVAIVLPWTVQAQQSLPYSYGFENNDLAADGWTTQGTTSSSTSIYNASSNAHDGSYFFRFHYSERNAYLVSPILDGTSNGVDVTFYYKQSSSTYVEQFQVGYTTDETVTDASAFTYGTTLYSTTSWTLYENTFPAGIKQIAIKYIYTNGYYLYLDDFSFMVPASCPKPTLNSTVITSSDSASLRWNENGTATDWVLQYSTTGNFTDTILVNISDMPECVISNLVSATTYYARVKADCDNGDESVWSNVVSFTTKCDPIVILPWSENFESFNASSSGVTLSDPCWVNKHVDGSGTNLFSVSSSTQSGNSTKKLVLPDMNSGTMTKLMIPGITLPAGNNYQFVLDVYRNTYSSYADEGIRVFASTDGEMEGATELAFISRNYTVSDNGLIPAESASGWYTYELPIPFTGTCYIVLRGESQFGSATYMDNFKVEKIPTCLSPTALAAESITANSAVLYWTANSNETEWTIYYKKVDDTNYTEVIGVTDNPYTLSGLDAVSNYEYYVVANCFVDEQSESSDVFTFTTECGTITSLPWNENFNSYTADIASSVSAPSSYPNNQLPICWQFLNRSTTSSSYPQAFLSSYSDYAVSGNCLFFKSSSTTPIYAILPEFDEVTSVLQLTFTYRYERLASANGTLYVGYMTDPTDVSTFTPVYSCAQTTTKTTVTAYFVDAPANSRMAFKYQGESNNYYLGIDDVVVDMAPACFAPTDLTVNGFTATTAILRWISNADAWQIMLNDDETNLIDVTENPYTLTGLTPETAYTARVRTNCGIEHGMSAWSNVVNFMPSNVIVIGSDESGSSYVPFNNYFNYSLTQQIYTVEELGPAGFIERIDFYKTNTASTVRDLNIYMVSTEKYSFESSSDWIPVTFDNLVFSGTVTFADNAWTTIALDEDFVYDGTKNVAIIVDDNTGEDGSTAYFRSFTTDARQAIYYYNGYYNYDPTDAPGSASGTMTSKNQIRIFKSDRMCMRPSHLSVTEIGSSSAVLNWEGEAENYNVRYITDVYLESFENGIGNWTVYPGGDSGAIEWYVDDPSQTASLTAHSGNNVVWSFSDAGIHSDDWLVSPQLNLGGTLKYWAMSEYQDAYEVVLFGPNIDTVTLRPLSASTITWTEVSIDLSAYEGQRGHIAFHHDHTGGFFLMIDDIGIYGWSEPIHVNGNSYVLEGLTPETEYKWQVQADCGEEADQSRWVEGSFTTGISCNSPTGLDVDVSSITAHSATVNWDAEEGVTFQYSLPNLYHPNINPETLTFIDIQGNSKTLNNLRADTDYGFYLRKDCGENGYSEIRLVTFHTAIACPTPTNVEVTNIFSHSAILAWEGPSESYNVMYRTAAYNDPVFSEGFENGIDNWTLRDCHSGTGLSTTTSYVHSGRASFVFNYSSNPPQYLISPELSNDTIGMRLEFYYKNYSTTWAETFQIGFSSTDNQTASFVFGEEITASDGQWHLYSETIPVGTKFVCWKLNSDDRYYLCIDDVLISEEFAAGEWQTVAANDTTCVLSELMPSTQYEAKVQSDCGSEGMSNESEVIAFTTLENCPQPRDIEVSNVTRHNATVNWTGDSESFTVSYRVYAEVDGDEEEFGTSIPAGWENKSGLLSNVMNGTALSNITRWRFGAKNSVFDNHAFLNIYGDSRYGWLITPEITLGNDYGVGFDLALTNSYNENEPVQGTCDDDRFIVLVYADEAWHILREWNNSGSSYIYNNIATNGENVVISLSDYNGKTVKLAFYGESTVGSNGDNNLHIDNVAIGASIAGEWQTVTVTEGATTAYITGLEADTRYDLKVIPSCDETNESDIVNFTTMDGDMKIFLTQGDWGDATNWMDEEMPTLTDMAVLRANATITGVAEADQITFEGTSTLTIADGGQLKTNNDVLVTMKKNIMGYGTNNASTDYGYCLITAPTVSYWSAADYGLITADSLYDLYSWNRTATDEEWYNTKNNSSDFYMYNGMGYLYANENDVEMSFTYPVKSSSEPVVMTPEYDEVFKGWNLYGNPFPCDAYVSTEAEGMTFYRLIGNELVPITGAIAPMEGFFVKATAAGQTFTISREAPRGR